MPKVMRNKLKLSKPTVFSVQLAYSSTQGMTQQLRVEQ